MKKHNLWIALFLIMAAALPNLAQAKEKQILMVVTSSGQISAGNPTGLWLEEFAVPYLKFRKEGFKVTVASSKGGQAPVDPRSLKDGAKVLDWAAAAVELKNTLVLKEVSALSYDAIFLPGGHGTMFDFPNDLDLKRLLNHFAQEGKVIAAVCHGPSGLVGAKKADGTPLVAGKTITAFTNEEERAAELDKEMPFPLESKLREEGAKFVVGEKWAVHVEVDGKLVTGQNPASSSAAAEAVVGLLK